MSTFKYLALTDSGHEVKGTIEADSNENAKEVLAMRGYIPLNVKRSSGGLDIQAKLEQAFSPIKPRDIILFTKQLKTMISAGISIVDIMETLIEQTENKKLKNVILQIQKDIEEGSSLFEAFKSHNNVFSDLYCNMIQAGEKSGSLSEVLERLIYIIEHDEKIKSDVKSALTYPVIVLSFLGVAFVVLLMFVIPKFTGIFMKAGINIPFPTKVCLLLYNFASTFWPLIIAGLIALVAGLKLWFKTENGAYLKDRFILSIPVIGEVVIKATMSRFSSIFAILQESGISILDSLDVLSSTLGNKVISLEFDRLKTQLKEGLGISAPLKQSEYFPSMVTGMISVGEESGDLPKMLSEISNHYDSEVEYATKQMSDAIGPMLTLALAGMVGFFALAIFLPMWDLTKLVH